MKLFSWKTLAILVIVATAWMILSQSFDRSLSYHHDWNGAHYGVMAKNHLKYGLAQTQLAQVTSLGDVTPAEFKYDFHHPVGYVLVLAISQFIGGGTEPALRLPGILATMLSCFFLFKLATRWWSWREGLIAALLPLATPMLRYFSSVPMQEPLVLAAILGQLYAYELWFTTLRVKYRRHTVIWGIIACLLGWPGYYLSAILALHWWWYQENGQPRIRRIFSAPVLLLLSLPVGMFSLHLLHTKWVTGSWGGGGLGKSLLFRLSMNANQAASFTPQQFISQSARWLAVYYTRILLVLSSIGFITIIWDYFKKRSTYRHGLVIGLLVYGLMHPLIFRNAAYIHEYMWIYLVPFLSLSSTWILMKVFNKLPFKKVTWLVSLLLIFSLMWWERDAFVKTLFTGKLSHTGHELGLILQQQPLSSKPVLVTNGEFFSFFGKFAEYYSDKKLIGSGVDFETNDNYSVIAIPKTHRLPAPETIEKLDQDYDRHETENFIWYSVN